MHGQLASSDSELASLLTRDRAFYGNSVDLIAGMSEPMRAVVCAVGMIHPNRTTEGQLHQRYLGTGGTIDAIEDLAIRRARAVFGFSHANVQIASGTQANIAALQALCQPGDAVLAMNLRDGGHLSHGFRSSLSGKLYRTTTYGVAPGTSLLDLDQVRRGALQVRPRVIIAGASAYPRHIDYAAFADIAQEVGAFLLLDVAHPAGFIAAGFLRVPHAPHVLVSMTTEKTLCGPRGGLLLCSDTIGRQIDNAVFPCVQSSFTVSVVAGKAAMLHEVTRPQFRTFQRDILRNGKLLAEELQELGLKLLTDGTDSHIVVVDLGNENHSGVEVENALLAHGIMANRQVLPGDKRPPKIASGIRFGTTCWTIHNMQPEHIIVLANCLASLVSSLTLSEPLEKSLTELRHAYSTQRRHPLFETP